MSKLRPSHALPLLLALSPLSLAMAQSPATPTAAPAEARYPGTIELTVDATDLARRVFHVHQSIPVQPGSTVRLLYPKWIPGKHRPDGPIHRVAGLKISGNGQRVEWTRDPADVYAFVVEVPAGVDSLDVRFDKITPTGNGTGRIVMTRDMFNLEWGEVALYPAGYDVSFIPFSATLKLPAGWQAGTALEPVSKEGSTVHYRTVNFETLQDSPVYAGRHFKQIDLDPGAGIPVMLDIVADAPKYLEATEEQIAKHRELIDQAYELFDSQHFDHYDFLLSLSDRMGGNGLEHHRSSENGVQPGYFINWDKNVASRDLLPHEFVHSWNGKFRRPAGLATPDFHTPMQDSLLWVYEGQTQYWGMVLAARSGLWSKDDTLGALALVAATYADNRPGLDWRTVQDTTHDPIIAERAAQPWRSYQLSEDYYNAGALIWLAVDAQLRELTRGRKSLDDFASAFFGVRDGSWEVMPYTFDDIVAALNGVAEHDWATFLRSRLDANAPPLDGLEAAGWKLVYRDEPSGYHKAVLGARKSADFTHSLGFSVRGGDVAGVRWDSPAFEAGILPGSDLVAVNGHSFETELLEDAIKAAKADGTPIELVVEHGEVVRTVQLDYRGGLKYPHLERIEGSEDRLSDILEPL